MSGLIEDSGVNSSTNQRRTLRRLVPLAFALTIAFACGLFPATAGAASGPAYAISDFGAPVAASNQPFSFNNTGQIAGIGRSASDPNRQDCFVWTGTGYRNLTPPGVEQCTLGAVNDKNATTGAYRAAGSANTVFLPSVPLVVTVTGSGKAAFTLYTGNQGYFGEVNESGLAYGTGRFDPPGTTTNPNRSTPFLVAGPESAELSFPQACESANQCVNGVAQPGACGFHCSLNDENQLVGVSDFNEIHLDLYDLRTRRTTVIANATPTVSLVEINDSGQIATAAFDPNGRRNSLFVYNINTGKSAFEPALPGFTCDFLPIGQNNRSVVFGSTSNCANVAQNGTYWIWDAAHGMRNLSSMLPASTYAQVLLLGLNDRSQFLAKLVLKAPAGFVHWGILNPIR